MNEDLKLFLEDYKQLIKENKWCELYEKAGNEGNSVIQKLANFLFDGLGQETMLDCFSEEGEIPDFAFAGCGSLTSITIPNSVTSIGDCAFYGCTCHIIFECDKKVVTKNAIAGFNGTYEFK